MVEARDCCKGRVSVRMRGRGLKGTGAFGCGMRGGVKRGKMCVA